LFGVLGATAGEIPYARVEGEESNKTDDRSLVLKSDGGDDPAAFEGEKTGSAGLASIS
jgi:hypothetical protein